MFFHDSKQKEEKRQELKQIITEGKAKGLSLEEMKTIVEQKELDAMFLFGSWHHALDYLEVSAEEYDALGFWRFML